MKKCVILIAAFLFYFTNTSFKLPATELVIEITNLKNDNGFVLISLFNNEDDFPENAVNAVKKAKVKITGKTAIASIKDIPSGKYACAILHDENENLKMDFNFLGIPKEGYGFSNNAKGLFGPPHFSKAAFKVTDENKKIIIRAIYF